MDNLMWYANFIDIEIIIMQKLFHLHVMKLASCLFFFSFESFPSESNTVSLMI